LAKTLAIPERLGASFKGFLSLKIRKERVVFHLDLLFLDLFEGLTPVVVHQAMAAWDVRKMEIVNVEVGRMREANQMLNG
jgi:programmed cell death 6-interacting protein